MLDAIRSTWVVGRGWHDLRPGTPSELRHHRGAVPHLDAGSTRCGEVMHVMQHALDRFRLHCPGASVADMVQAWARASDIEWNLVWAALQRKGKAGSHNAYRLSDDGRGIFVLEKMPGPGDEVRPTLVTYLRLSTAQQRLFSTREVFTLDELNEWEADAFQFGLNYRFTEYSNDVRRIVRRFGELSKEIYRLRAEASDEKGTGEDTDERADGSTGEGDGR